MVAAAKRNLPVICSNTKKAYLHNNSRFKLPSSAIKHDDTFISHFQYAQGVSFTLIIRFACDSILHARSESSNAAVEKPRVLPNMPVTNVANMQRVCINQTKKEQRSQRTKKLSFTSRLRQISTVISFRVPKGALTQRLLKHVKSNFRGQQPH